MYRGLTSFLILLKNIDFGHSLEPPPCFEQNLKIDIFTLVDIVVYYMIYK